MPYIVKRSIMNLWNAGKAYALSKNNLCTLIEYYQYAANYGYPAAEGMIEEDDFEYDDETFRD